MKKVLDICVISDLHLGTHGCRAEELLDYLKHIEPSRLILNGDIVDGWHLQKGGKGKWKKEHTDFFKIIMKMMENHNTKVVYVRGNHDDFLDNIAPFSFANISIVKDYLHERNGRKYYVVHGDVFDHITTKMRWLAQLGDIGYTFLLWVNRFYNYYRMKRGLEYFSLSQSIKAKVKSAVSYISNYETELVDLARNRGVDGIICGHIHQPADKMIDNIHYLNSGDWVETMSALLEHEDGSWEVYMHSEVKKMPHAFELIEIERVKSKPFQVAFSNNIYNPYF